MYCLGSKVELWSQNNFGSEQAKNWSGQIVLDDRQTTTTAWNGLAPGLSLNLWHDWAMVAIVVVFESSLCWIVVGETESSMQGQSWSTIIFRINKFISNLELFRWLVDGLENSEWVVCRQTVNEQCQVSREPQEKRKKIIADTKWEERERLSPSDEIHIFIAKIRFIVRYVPRDFLGIQLLEVMIARVNWSLQWLLLKERLELCLKVLGDVFFKETRPGNRCDESLLLTVAVSFQVLEVVGKQKE